MKPEQRLLNTKDAAAYCGMTAKTFKEKCTVRPIALGVQFARYDRLKIDEWIEKLQNISSTPQMIDQSDPKFWLEKARKNEKENNKSTKGNTSN